MNKFEHEQAKENSLFFSSSIDGDGFEKAISGKPDDERSSCGVGFVVNLNGDALHDTLKAGLLALRCEEHRGACGADQISSDGSGIMTDIPFEYFGYEKGSVAIAILFIPLDLEGQRIALKIFAETFGFLGLEVTEFRDVPINAEVLGKEALRTMPAIKQVVIARPNHCRTDASFNRLLYTAKQITRTKVKEYGLSEFYFASLSTNTIVYKALTKGDQLDQFYLDLQNPKFKTRFVMFHRRFSTNTRTAWDKAQPFRVIAHNGEINTIAGNRSWSYSREKSLGLGADELLTHHGISDTGSMNEMVEALLYRSSIPHIEDILAIMIPPAASKSPFYKFWSRAMEPWDGPAFITFADGQKVGGRLDRNGFRPCRWAKTTRHFFVSSEAGSFDLDESKVLSKGTLQAGTGVTVNLETGEVDFTDPSDSSLNRDANFDAKLTPIQSLKLDDAPRHLSKMRLFGYTEEDLHKILAPMITTGKEPIGSMGDTARPAILSKEPRAFFDYFYQNFAQVTNPPVDYLRESTVTDLSIYLGKKPNIFSPQELIPPPPAIELRSPLLSLSQMAYLQSLVSIGLIESRRVEKGLTAYELDITFKRSEGEIGFKSKLASLQADAVKATQKGASILILSDRSSDYEHPPIPSLLALRAVIKAMNASGVRLDASLVIHTAEVRNTHQLSCLIGFGAAAVCPYLALEIARYQPIEKTAKLGSDEKEKNLIKAFESGLLKVMSKMGISVAKSYQSARLFSAIGIGKKLASEYFVDLYSPIGGIEIKDLVEEILHNTFTTTSSQFSEKLIHTYQFKEHNKGLLGEKHSMTNARSKVIHRIVREKNLSLNSSMLYEEYLKQGEADEPINLRHLFDLKKQSHTVSIESVEPIKHITSTFGSGGMSFGAISAESQRDLFDAMRQVGGRSNSGEGGENPYYFKEGIFASTKQIASARFGVTAEYLVTANEIQIKVAQGAKPGEGGQLMSVKVTEDIAKARHALPGIDLISPPPLHDIYSIEDLKELIYELKQTHPKAKVSVKLVSGANIGTIAVGVAKAGADIIQVSGADGGTGAASLSSMKHAGLPWEIGLLEAHHALVENGLRESIILRTDGGLSTGKDVVFAAILGAEEYDFGKLLLVAQGCVMARICETNTCPTGIATHDPKFKAKYKGSAEHVVSLLEIIAEDVRRHLSLLGLKTLKSAIGRTDLLILNPKAKSLIESRNLDLSFFLKKGLEVFHREQSLYLEGVNPLNQSVLNDCASSIPNESNISASYSILPTDRAIPATLSGEIGKYVSSKRLAKGFADESVSFGGNISLSFTGSAGQGFGVFMPQGLTIRLAGEANDSVCKGMSGGKCVIVPHPKASFTAEENVIIGNCALYGATGGTLYVHGHAGDRFAVRNSGATAVVEGVGLHACEYMTNGRIVILGEASGNIGAGMTGGELFLFRNFQQFINYDYLQNTPFDDADESRLISLLTDYLTETGSTTAKQILADWQKSKSLFTKYLPIAFAKKKLEETEIIKLN
ncbi:MAG: glutamate synthase large subunit [Chloroherpetonaceae bacterium]|nr:glutamate synthase large subunit [Chloroherpetonaceae bacterium]